MINKLTEVYNNWCNKNNLPNISADEHDRDKLTYEQKTFLDNFIEMWDYQQEVDYFIDKNLKTKKENFEIKSCKIKDINKNDGHVLYDAKNHIIIDLNKKQ